MGVPIIEGNDVENAFQAETQDKASRDGRKNLTYGKKVRCSK